MGVRGRFITLEGIEGAGKSTQMEAIRTWLKGQGIPLVTTREPGGSPIAERMRALLLDPACRGMVADAELLLIFAARAEHIASKIQPALARGHWVLCDRFTDATYAYQGGGRGVEVGRIALLEDYVQGSLRPDLTILFDLPVALGLARAGKRSVPDRFESEAVPFFEDVRAAYLALAWADPARVRVVDAAAPATQVSAQVHRLLDGFLAGAIR